MCYRLFSSILGLYPLDASSSLTSCDYQKCLQTLPDVSWGQTLPGPQHSLLFPAPHLPLLAAP